MAHPFDDPKRTRAPSMLAQIGGEGLMSDEEFAQPFDATRHCVATAGQSPSVACPS